MTDETLKAIEERANKATPGPWTAEPSDPNGWSDEEPHCDGIHTESGGWRNAIVTTDGGVYGPRMPDADFIAHAREDVPKLLGEVRRLRADVQRLERAADARLRDMQELAMAKAQGKL